MKKNKSKPEYNGNKPKLSLEARVAHCEELLIESEHRFISVMLNLFKSLNTGTKNERLAAIKALFYFLLPSGRTTTFIFGGSIIGFLTLFLMQKNNELMVDNNYYSKIIAYSQQQIERNRQQSEIIERLARPVNQSTDKPFYNAAIRERELENLIDLTKNAPFPPEKEPYESILGLSTRMLCINFGIFCHPIKQKNHIRKSIFIYESSIILPMLNNIKELYCKKSGGINKLKCYTLTNFIENYPKTLDDFSLRADLLLILAKDKDYICGEVNGCKNIDMLRADLSTSRPKLILDNMYLNDITIPKLHGFKVSARNVDFSNSEFKLIYKFIGADLRGANFAEAKFSRMFLYDSQIDSAAWVNAELKDAIIISSIIDEHKKIDLKGDCETITKSLKGLNCK